MAACCWQLQGPLLGHTVAHTKTIMIDTNIIALKAAQQENQQGFRAYYRVVAEARAQRP